MALDKRGRHGCRQPYCTRYTLRTRTCVRGRGTLRSRAAPGAAGACGFSASLAAVRLRGSGRAEVSPAVGASPHRSVGPLPWRVDPERTAA